MKIRNWKSSSKEFIKGLHIKNTLHEKEKKVLGLMWEVNSDKRVVYKQDASMKWNQETQRYKF